MEMTNASRKEDTMPWKGKVGDEATGSQVE